MWPANHIIAIAWADLARQKAQDWSQSFCQGDFLRLLHYGQGQFMEQRRLWHAAAGALEMDYSVSEVFERRKTELRAVRAWGTRG